MMNRLFISFDIPGEIQNRIIDLRDQLYQSRQVKWEKKEKLHITAKFLGDTEESLIPDILSRLEEVIKKYSKIKAEFFRFGLFYKMNRPKILWLGLKENEKLTKLFRDIEDKLADLGFEKEKRKFKPHLTILRIKGNEDFKKIKEMTSVEFEPIIFDIQNVSLIKSELKPGGSVYSTIKSFELS